MKLSKVAWEISAKMIAAIKNHPFNQELMKGTLSQKKFAYYIEQDILYLREFARAHALIASKVPLPYIRQFLRYAEYTFIAEQEVVHQYFKKIFNFKETGLLTPATLSYTSYLLRICAIESVEVAVAAILPCFWVYREVGLYMHADTNSTNPYWRWIKTYASTDFALAVEEAIAIFDALADEASAQTRQKMLEVFYTSTCLEWHFWNDAYQQFSFDAMNNDYAVNVPIFYG